ncbi:MAG: hypothetical protein HRU19_22520 [Pseudobacteriovorax sp.]|nr:hypothetical protein [Pseudobacteriovorax sp.]
MVLPERYSPYFLAATGCFLGCLSHDLSARDGGIAWRARAREHYEVQRFYKGNQRLSTHRGLTNTFNLWYELPPFAYMGFALNPIIGSLRSKDNKQGDLTSLIRHYHLGGELLVNIGLTSRLNGPPQNSFYHWIQNSYVRAGWYFSSIDNGGNKKSLNGSSLLYSYIYKWELDGLDIAFEIGGRVGWYARDIEMTGEHVAIGFHFLPGQAIW